MSEGLLYPDYSTLVKLVLPEPETEALLKVLRAVRRAGEASTMRRRAEEVVARVGLLRIDAETLDFAASFDPRGCVRWTRSTSPPLSRWGSS